MKLGIQPAFSWAVYREKNYDVCRWSEDHVRIPGSPPMGARIRMNMTPWLRAPMNCFSDATTERIVLMSSAQVGKTLSALCMTMWSIVEQPGNLLFCQHTEAAAKDFGILRLNPILNECEPVVSLMPSWNVGGARTNKKLTARNANKILFSSGSWLQCKPANKSSMRGHSAGI